MNIYGCQEDRRDCLSTDLVGCKRRERQGQRQAAAHGYRIVDEFYDAAVSGADPVTERPGFRAMLDRIAGDGVRVILVESPDRFAGGGVFSEEVRRGRRDQLDLLGAIPQFEKASLIGKGSGRKTLAEARPETVALAKQLHAQGLSLRRIS